MNPKQTWWLVFSALSLFGFIYFFERYQPSTSQRQEARLLLGELTPGGIEQLELALTSNGTRVALSYSNQTWLLVDPPYPAQQTPVQNFVQELVKLRAYDKLGGNEVLTQGLGNFGLEPPQGRISVRASTNSIELLLGKRTPLTNHLYVRIGPERDVYITDASILEKLPVSRDQWRDRTLLNLPREAFNAFAVRSGQRVVELRRNPTNRLWQITKPIPARADQDRIALILDQLDRGTVGTFVAENADGELERFGLQVPQLEVGFYRGTNEVGQLQFGRVLTNDATSVYARLPIYSNVVTTSRAFAELLNQPYKAFHDPRLIDFPLSAVQRVVVDGTETFLLEQTHSNTWLVVHTNQYAADSALVTRFLTNVAGLQILDIAREVASVEDLSTFGFSPARLSFRFYSHQGNSGAVATNALLAQIEFGSNLVDTIYMRRTDEVPIYLGQLADVLTLPRRAYEFRDRQLWTAQEPHVLAISISSEGKRVDLRRQENSQWHSDPITGAAIQELVHRVVTVKAQHWINKGDQRLSSYGLSNPSLTLVLALNSPTLPRIELHFGRFTVRRDVYAATILPGEHEPVVFEFPGFLYHELRNFFFPQN